MSINRNAIPYYYTLRNRPAYHGKSKFYPRLTAWHNETTLPLAAQFGVDLAKAEAFLRDNPDHAAHVVATCGGVAPMPELCLVAVRMLPHMPSIHRDLSKLLAGATASQLRWQVELVLLRNWYCHTISATAPYAGADLVEFNSSVAGALIKAASRDRNLLDLSRSIVVPSNIPQQPWWEVWERSTLRQID